MKVVQRLAPLSLCLAIGLAGCSGDNTPQGPVLCPTGVVSCTTSSQCPSGDSCVSGCCATATGCTTAADCTNPANPHCDTTTNTCQPCANNGQCVNGEICLLPAGTCQVGCASAADCASVTGKPACFPSGTVSYCAQCGTSSDCHGATPICTAGVCTGCASNSDCHSTTAPVCDTTAHACVACLDASNVSGVNPACPSSAPACESKACVTCNPANNASNNKNGACASSAPVCSSSSSCVVCLPANNDPTTGVNPACTAPTAVCDSGTACVGCLTDGQCAGTAGSYCDSSATKTCKLPRLSTFPNVTVGSGNPTTLTLTLDHAAVTALDVAVALGTGSTATLSAATIHIAQGQTTGTVTYNAPTISGANVSDSVTATLGAQTLTSTITITSAPSTLASILGPGMAAGPVYVAAGQAITLSVNLTVSASLSVALSQNGTLGTLNPASTLTFTNQQTANVTYTAGAAAGSTTVTVNYTPPGGPAATPVSIVVNVFKVNPTLSVSAPLIPLVTSGSSTSTLTVGLDSAPPVPVTVTLSTGTTPANLLGGVPLSVTTFNFAAGATTPTGGATSVFTAGSGFLDGSSSPTTDTATITASTPGGTNATASVRMTPTVASLTLTDPVTNTFDGGLGTDSPTGLNLKVTLNVAAPIGGTTVFLTSATNFANHSKYKTFVPTSVAVAAGSTSQQIGGGDSAAYPTPVFACYSLTSSTPDVATLIAAIPGAPTAGATASFNVIKNVTGVTGLCPLQPFDVPHPITTPQVPLIFTVSFSNITSPATPIVDFATGTTPPDVTGTSIVPGTNQYNCGTVQTGGTAIGAGGLTISSTTPSVFSAQVTYVPPANPTPGSTCYVRAYLRCSSATGASDAGNFFPGVGNGEPTLTCTGLSGAFGSGASYLTKNTQLARIKLVAATASTPSTLLLNKVEVDGNGAPDTHEYAEIINKTGNGVALTGYKLLLIQNANLSDGGVTGDSISDAGITDGGTQFPKSEVLSIDLGAGTSAGTLSANNRLVVSDHDLSMTLTAGSGSLQYVVDIPDAGTAGLNNTNDGNLKNSPAAVALVDPTGAVVDSLTWGGPEFNVTAADVSKGCAAGTGAGGTGTCAFDLYGAGNPLDIWILDQVGSTSATTCTYPATGPCFINTFVRAQDGVTTGNQAADWRTTTTATPGVANTVTGP